MSPVIDALSREHPKMFFHVVSGRTEVLYSAVPTGASNSRFAG
jgi:hypothetical protein